MHTEVRDDLDPALASDKRFLIQHVDLAKKAGGYTFGFKTASEARKARRRIYYVISNHMAEWDRKQMDEVMFQLKGRMIAIVPKVTLSSAIVQETTPCLDSTSGADAKPV